MARIAGVKTIKNSRGKITHVTLSMKHHAKYLEDLLNSEEMDKARKGDTIIWPEAQKSINKKFHFKD